MHFLDSKKIPPPTLLPERKMKDTAKFTRNLKQRYFCVCITNVKSKICEKKLLNNNKSHDVFQQK